MAGEIAAGVLQPEGSMKQPKDKVQFEHPGMGKDRCRDCVHYQPITQTCEVVIGHIEPQDWCRLFSRARKK
jgi:hypothetical protein